MPNVLAYFSAGNLVVPQAIAEALDTLDRDRLRPLLRTSLDELLVALDGGAVAPDLAAALPAGLLDAARKEWQALKARAIDRLPERLRPLAFRLRDLTQATDLPLFSTSTDAPLGPHFNVQGNVAFGLEIQAGTPFDPPLSDGTALVADETTLRLGLDGRVGVGVKGGVSFGWGDVRAGADATAQTDLDFWFARPTDEFLAASLFRIGPASLAFADLPALRDARARGLRRLTLAAKGVLDVNAGLSAGASAVFEIGPTALTAQPIKIIGHAGASLALQASFQGNYLVRVDFEQDGDVTIVVDRSTQADRSLSLELGVDVRIDGLAAQANDIVDNFLPDAAPLLAAIDKYKDPVGLLKQRLEDALGRELQGAGSLAPVAESLGQLLLGDTTAGDVTSGIASTIATRATKALDAQVAEAIAQGDVAIGQLASEAAGHLPDGLEASVASALQKVIAGAFESALKGIAGELEKQIRTELGKAGVDLAAVLKPLEAVGEDVDALQKQVAADVSAAIAPIEAFITKYQALRQKVIDALEKTATEKLGLAFGASLTRSVQDQALLRCRLSDLTPELQRFYQALLIGRVDMGALLASDGTPRPGVALVDGTFTQTVRDQRVVGFTLNVFGFAASQTFSRVSTVQIGRDLAGRIVLASSGAFFAEATKAFDYVKTARIDFGFEAKVEGAQAVTTAPTITTAFTLAEEKTSFAAVMSYLGSLRDAGLLSNGGYTRAKAALFRDDTREERHLQDLALGLRLVVDRDGWQRWLALDDAQVFALFSASYFEAASRFVLAGWDVGPALARLAALMSLSAQDAFGALCKIGATSLIEAEILRLEQRSSRMDLPSGLRSGYLIVQTSAGAAARVMSARATWRSFVQLALTALDSPAPDLRGRLDALNRTLTGELTGTVASALTLVGNEQVVPPLTSGFLLGMLRATSGDVQLVPVKISYDENGPHDLVLM